MALQRLKAALALPPIGISESQLVVTQGPSNTIASGFAANARFIPALDDKNGHNLSSVPELWGHRRDLWKAESGGVIAGHVVYPMSRDHVAATSGSKGLCGLHFMFDGAAIEVLCAGTDVRLTLVIDGHYGASRIVENVLAAGVAGLPLASPNALVRIDFGSAASRRLSLYATSSQGPCALVVHANSRVEPWDRSAEASFAAITDSYGQAPSRQWGATGPFYEAAALLGIPHVDRDAIGGTGYAPNNATSESRNPGNAFVARLGSSVDAQPDLVLTAGGLTDNNSVAALPLYASAAEARAGFDTAVARHYRDLRSALPSALLVATGPWAPRQAVPADAVARSKAETIRSALAAVGGLWVYLDNLDGTWSNSAGASGTSSGPWQTGTGHAGEPRGDGNGDLFLSSDGVHPNEAGCLNLATRIADDLRAAINLL